MSDLSRINWVSFIRKISGAQNNSMQYYLSIGENEMADESA